jgi:hypothetical protein
MPTNTPNTQNTDFVHCYRTAQKNPRDKRVLDNSKSVLSVLDQKQLDKYFNPVQVQTHANGSKEAIVAPDIANKFLLEETSSRYYCHQEPKQICLQRDSYGYCKDQRYCQFKGAKIP